MTSVFLIARPARKHWVSQLGRWPAFCQQRNSSLSLPDLKNSLAKADIAVLYGTHSGNIETLARRFARELEWRLNLRVRCASFNEFRYDSLAKIPSKSPLVLFVSTRGDGECTITTRPFAREISKYFPQEATSGHFARATLCNDSAQVADAGKIPSSSSEAPETSNADNDMNSQSKSNQLANLRYCIFGRGSTLYKDTYNAACRRFDDQLGRLGAKRLGQYAEIDALRENLTEDRYFEWKEAAINAIAASLGKQEQPYAYIPQTRIHTVSDHIDLAALSKLGPQDGGPDPVVVNAHVKKWTDSTNRLFADVSFDLSKTNLKYQTGDHVLVWPENHPVLVRSFLSVFGLWKERFQPISVDDKLITTWETLASRYLAISAPITRELLQHILGFVVSSEVKEKLVEVLSDSSKFNSAVKQTPILAQFLRYIAGPNESAYNIPPSFLIDALPKLSPRSYSATSSSELTPYNLEITAVVPEADGPYEKSGYSLAVGSQYLFRLGSDPSTIVVPMKRLVQDPEEVITAAPSSIGDSRLTKRYLSPERAVISVRPSNLRLPDDPEVPLICIGLGTGISAFCGLMEERWLKSPDAQTGKNQIKDMLFAGCRDESAFPRKEAFRSAPGLKVYHAFSRGRNIHYVQDVLWKRRGEIMSSIDAGATVYVCGSLKLARHDVRDTLIRIIAKARNIDFEEAKAELKSMKKLGKYRADMW